MPTDLELELKARESSVVRFGGRGSSHVDGPEYVGVLGMLEMLGMHSCFVHGRALPYAGFQQR